MNKYALFIFLMVLTASVKGQGVPISQLPPVSGSYHGSLDTSAVLPVVQDSVPGKKKTYKVSISNLKSLIGNNVLTGPANQIPYLDAQGNLTYDDGFVREVGSNKRTYISSFDSISFSSSLIAVEPTNIYMTSSNAALMFVPGASIQVDNTGVLVNTNYYLPYSNGSPGEVITALPGGFTDWRPIRNSAWALSGNNNISYPDNYIGSSTGATVSLSSGEASHSGNIAYVLAHRSEPGVIGSISLFDNDSIYEEVTSFGTHWAAGIGKVLSIKQGSYDGDSSSVIKLTKDSLSFEFTKGLGVSQSYTMPAYKPSAGQVLGATTGNGHLDWISPGSSIQADSVTIYSLTPSNFAVYACTDCTGNGITGALLTYIGGLWRRLRFD